jgi:enoyl-CoA hydratase/carnithine racemase
MEYETILLAKNEGIATITLNRPEKLNAWSARMAEESRDALQTIDADGAARVVVITGAGRAFCAGADVGGFDEAIPARRSPAQTVRDETRRDFLGCTLGDRDVASERPLGGLRGSEIN